MNKLAIVIPYFKIKFFDQCLRSLNDQSNKNFTVYIGDDSSDNEPSDIIKQYQNTLNIKYTRFSTNLGNQYLTRQWDRCIELTESEEWIMVLGDDDVLDSKVVEEFYNNINTVNTAQIKVIRFASQLIDEIDNITSKVYFNPQFEKAATSYIRTLEGNGRSTLSEHVFTRSTYEKHGFKNFPVAFGSDNVAWLEFPDMGNIFSINTAVVSVRISKEHLSSRDDNGLRYKKRLGIYLFNRYIIANYEDFFEEPEKLLILKRAYRNLRFATRNKLKTLEFIAFMFSRIGWKTIDIIKNNRWNE